MKKLIGAFMFLVPSLAMATGFTDIGQDLTPREAAEIDVHGYMRVRADGYDNFDLDRGPTPSGQLFFPVPLANPASQWLEGADARLRTDIAAYAPGATVAVKARIDVLDNVALGSAPIGIPAASTSQAAPTSEAFVVKRAWGEALTPVGLLAAGRMGSAWGLGILTNGGDCGDCNTGDSADRVAFLTTLIGNIWAVAFDLDGTGPQTLAADHAHWINTEPADDVHTLTFATLHWSSDRARARRSTAGLMTIDWGAYTTYRWQNDDVPATYLPLAAPVAITPSQEMERGYQAGAVDGWFRLTTPSLRVEAELSVLSARVAQPSLVPGVLLPHPATSQQEGGALESEYQAPGSRIGFGIDTGFASGDPTPGFSCLIDPGAPAPVQGDLHGAHVIPPTSYVDNSFCFHPDYRIDRILFHEIIGTVSNAIYLRPHAQYQIAHVGPSDLTASVAAIGSRAIYASSTPGGAAPLGIEVDPTLAYGSTDGFVAALEYGVLFPLAGLDNTQLGLRAQPAQSIQVRLMYLF